MNQDLIRKIDKLHLIDKYICLRLYISTHSVKMQYASKGNSRSPEIEPPRGGTRGPREADVLSLCFLCSDASSLCSLWSFVSQWPLTFPRDFLRLREPEFPFDAYCRWQCGIPHSLLTPWTQYSRTFLLNWSEKFHKYSRSVSDLPVWLYSDRLQRRIQSRDGCTRTRMCPWYPSDTSGRSQGNFL